MIRYLPSFLIALAVGAGIWWVVGMRAENAALTADNGRLTRSLGVLQAQAEHARLSRDVAAAYTARERELKQEATAKVEAILTGSFGGCIDEAIDPDISDLLDGRNVQP